MNNISVFKEGETSLKRYFSEIGKLPLLTRDQEIDLGKRIIRGDKEALKTLVEHNLKYVVYEANKFKNNCGLPFLDVIQEGNLGMIHAATTWDYRKNVRFITYAKKHVKWTILTALYDKKNLVRQSMTRQKEKYKKFKELSKKNKDKTKSEIMDSLSAEERYSSLNQSYTSLNYLSDFSELHGQTKRLRRNSLAILKDDNSEKAFETIVDDDRRDYTRTKVNLALEDKKPRDVRIVTRMFGLDGRDPENPRMLSKKMGITHQRIAQLKDRVLNNIRKTYKEQDFYNDN
jgi:RNA polymerase primary sigma factor